MPNKPNPKNRLVGWRVPKDVVEEVQDVAREEGVAPGELLAELIRGERKPGDLVKRYRELRKRNGGRPLGKGRIIYRPSVKSPAPSKRNRESRRAAS